jgi:hypothetical protein
MLTAKCINLGLLLLKKIITISFLLLIFLGQAGYQFIPEAIREVHKEKMIKAILPYLKDEQLVKIASDDKEICWIEEDREFIYNGTMYDVVKTITVAGKTSLLCLCDQQEDKINSLCNKVTEQNSSQPGNHKNSKQPNLILEYIQTDLPASAKQTGWPIKIIFGEQLQPKDLSICIDIQAPPPRA